MHQCDGFWDCPLHGSDEFNCRKLIPLFIYLWFNSHALGEFTIGDTGAVQCEYGNIDARTVAVELHGHWDFLDILDTLYNES